MNGRVRIVFTLIVVAWLPQVFFVSCDTGASHTSFASEADVDQAVRFPAVYDQVIRPNCVRCHYSATSLPLDSFEAIRNTLVAGQPDYSLIVEVAQRNQDPHVPLSEADLILLRSWIAAGASR